MNFFERFKEMVEKKHIIPIIFVIDSSADMSIQGMRYMKGLLEGMMYRFAECNKNTTSRYKIEAAVLQYSSDFQWLTEGLVDPAGVQLPFFSRESLSNLGNALSELDAKLTQKKFFRKNNIYGKPYICFISGGTSDDDYGISLEKLKKNNWYQSADKAAIAIGQDADCNMLGQVVGDMNAVIHIHSLTLLEKILIGLYSSLLAESVTITNTAVPAITPPIIQHTAPTMPSMSIGGRDFMPADMWTPTANSRGGEFDADSVCYTTATEPSDEFDADCMCYSTIAFSNKADDTDEVCAFLCSPENYTEIPAEVKVSQVHFSAVAPKHIVKGEYAMIDIAVYENSYRNIVEQIIANADDEVKEVMGSSQNVADNTKIRMILSSPDIDVSDCMEVQTWHGRYLVFSFPVEIPQNYAKKQILFIATVYFNDVIATKLKFIVSCSTVREQKIQLTREDVLTAFISYASQDRSRVATIIQGMKKARPDMDIFFDIESLRSGEDWERALRAEIEKRDVLFLCWSHFAKNSEWVEKEWRYALTNKGLDSIEPVPLVSPAECPPPEELKSKHFNDLSLLYKEN